MANDDLSCSVISFLHATCMRYPKHLACRDDKSEITYEDLWQKSHIAAHNIQASFLPRKPVPVVLKKSCLALEIIWGIIKAGNCYCIIDPALPQTRISKMLSELKAERVISDTKHRNVLPKDVRMLEWQEILAGDYEPLVLCMGCSSFGF